MLFLKSETIKNIAIFTYSGVIMWVFTIGTLEYVYPIILLCILSALAMLGLLTVYVYQSYQYIKTHRTRRILIKRTTLITLLGLVVLGLLVVSMVLNNSLTN